MALLSEKSDRRHRGERRIAAATSSLSIGWDQDEQQSATKPNDQPQNRVRKLTLAACAVLLMWLVVSHSLVLYLADAAPKTALWLNPRQPEALVNLADQSLNANTPAFSAAFAGQGSQSQDTQNQDTQNQDTQSHDTGGSAAAVDGAPDAAGQTSAAEDKKPNGKAIAKSSSTDSEKVGSAFEAFRRNRSVDLSTVRAEVEASLANDPLDPRALRILGQAADAAGNDQDALKFMRAAASLSMHETVANYWLMQKSTEAGDYKAAIGYADVLLRTNLEMGPYVVPVLAHFAGIQASNGSVKALVDGNPPWRQMFFAYLPRSVADVRTPLDILLSLKATPTPPTADELGGYLTYLVDHKFYNLAYYAWLQFLPPEALQHVSLLYNGNFSTPLSGLPFDWQINQGSGVSIDIVPKPGNDGKRALAIDFLYGRVDYHSVNELVLLAPGTYQFEGKYQGELIGPRGLKWRVACASDPSAPIAESPMIGGEAPNWKEFKFNFTVPDANCAAQYIRVDLDARMASEQLVTGSMLFADLNLSRVTDESDSVGSDPDASDSQKSNE
jgi:hypothetical protein